MRAECCIECIAPRSVSPSSRASTELADSRRSLRSARAHSRDLQPISEASGPHLRIERRLLPKRHQVSSLRLGISTRSCRRASTLQTVRSLISSPRPLMNPMGSHAGAHPRARPCATTVLTDRLRTHAHRRVHVRITLTPSSWHIDGRPARPPLPAAQLPNPISYHLPGLTAFQRLCAFQRYRTLGSHLRPSASSSRLRLSA